MDSDHPQRIKAPEPPGLLLKRVFDRAKKLRLGGMANDPAYLAMVRQCPCLKCGMDPSSEAAHVRMSSAVHGKAPAMGKKPKDRHAVPLCASCHTRDPDSQHRIGEQLFWHNIGLNPLYVCDKLYAQRGDIVAMRAVIFGAIGERESISQWRDKR